MIYASSGFRSVAATRGEEAFLLLLSYDAEQKMFEEEKRMSMALMLLRLAS